MKLSVVHLFISRLLARGIVKYTLLCFASVMKNSFIWRCKMAYADADTDAYAAQADANADADLLIEHQWMGAFTKLHIYC